MARKRTIADHQIQAIPTEYAGIKFRSRFEANTAQQLDACGWRWEYERQSFLLPSGHYWPDFYLPDQQLWVECRGYEGKEQLLVDFALLQIEQRRALMVLKWNGLAAHFSGFGGNGNPVPAEWVFCESCRHSFMGALFRLSVCPFCKSEHIMFDLDERCVIEVRRGVVGCTLASEILENLTPLRKQGRHSMWDPLGYYHECEIGSGEAA